MTYPWHDAEHKVTPQVDPRRVPVDQPKLPTDEFAEALRNGDVVRVGVCSELLSVGLFGGRSLIIPLDRDRTSLIWDVALASARRQQAVDAAPDGEGR